MSAAAKVVRFLLAHDLALAAMVPDDRIVVGRIGPGTKLPALTIMHVSTIRRAQVKQSPTEFCTSRIQITVHAKVYGDQDAVQRLVRKALPPVRGVVNGVDVDSIQPGGTGPDVIDAATDLYMGSDDVIVTFNE